MWSRLAVLAWVLCCCVGCAVHEVSSAPAAPAEEPVSVQMLRVHPELKSQRFMTLLSFEGPADEVFLTGAGLDFKSDTTRAHTGQSSLRLEGGGGLLSVKLSSVMGAMPFPGEWTLAGAHFMSDRPARVTVSCEIAGEVIASHTSSLPPNRWTAAMIDLTGRPIPPRSGDSDTTLVFEFDAPGMLWCDDVLLLDNTRWLHGGESQADWTLVQRGFDLFCNSRGLFSFRLPSAQFDPAGWKVEESNALRMRFSSNGAERTLTVYRDGRAFRDGMFRPLTDGIGNDPLFAQQQQSPAQIQIPQPMGRVVRNSPGDANNDGYNEQRGAYTILVTGPRLEATLTPRSVPVLHPVLEISGLPAGKPLVTVEGSLVEKVARLSDGTVLVELPMRIDRAVTLAVRVQ